MTISIELMEVQILVKLSIWDAIELERIKARLKRVVKGAEVHDVSHHSLVSVQTEADLLVLSHARLLVERLVVEQLH
jgi:hypothetical protein